jgi:hypothetical protein
MRDASLRGSGARFCKLGERGVVALLREPRTSDVKPQCHSIPILLRVSAVACPAIARLYVTQETAGVFPPREPLPSRAGSAY